MSDPSIPVRQMIKNCIHALGGNASYSQIIDWVRQKYGDINEGTIRAQIIACTVNQPSRVHYPENNKPRKSDSRYDLFYSVGRGEIESYDITKHGSWELIEHNSFIIVLKSHIDQS